MMKRLELPAFDEPSWKDVNEIFGQNPGIHKEKLRNESLGGYVRIPRLLGIDETGLLYRGMSDEIISCFGGLRAGIYGSYKFKNYNNPATHGVGFKMSRGFATAYSKDRIFIEIEGYPVSTTIPGDYEVDRREAEVIDSYVGMFAEPPPFNDTGESTKPPEALIINRYKI